MSDTTAYFFINLRSGSMEPFGGIYVTDPKQIDDMRKAVAHGITAAQGVSMKDLRLVRATMQSKGQFSNVTVVK